MAAAHSALCVDLEGSSPVYRDKDVNKLAPPRMNPPPNTAKAPLRLSLLAQCASAARTVERVRERGERRAREGRTGHSREAGFPSPKLPLKPHARLAYRGTRALT